MLLQADTLNISKNTLNHNIDSIKTTDSVEVGQYIKINPQNNPVNINSASQFSADKITSKQYIFSVVEDSKFSQPQRPSIFTERESFPHQLKMQPKDMPIGGDWVFPVMLFTLLFSAVLIRFWGKIISSFIRGCFSLPALSLNTKNATTVNSLTFLPITLIFLPLTSFIIYVGYNIFGMEDVLKNVDFWGTIIRYPNYVTYILFYIVCLLIYFFKVVSVRFFALVFKSKKIGNYYVQTMLNFGVLGGFALILPIFLLLYVDNYYKYFCFYAVSFLFVLLIVIRILRCFYIIIKSFKFSHIYLFFYLCTLELLPIIITIKLLFF